MQVNVSVIVPVYNVERYIDRCIQSVLSQTYTDFELILVNDGSLDTSYEKCLSYAEKDSRVIVYSKSNGGSSSARNYGLAKSKGKWILFLDADDWIDPSTIEKYYNITQDKEVDLIYSDTYFAYDNCRFEAIPGIPYSQDKCVLIDNAIRSEWNNVGSLFVKRNIYIDNNIHFIEGVRYCEDFYCFILLFLHSKKIHYIKEPLYYYNQTNDLSIMHTFNISYIAGQLMVYDLIISELKRECILEFCKKNMYWRVLKSKEHYLLNPKFHHLFLEIIPDAHSYIWSCPRLSVKRKFLMWLLVHNFQKILNIILLLNSKL